MDELSRVQTIQAWRPPPPPGEDRGRRKRPRDHREPEDTVELNSESEGSEEPDKGPTGL